MNRLILIKYGELTTKKQNRNLFVNTLYQNIKQILKNYNFVYYVYYPNFFLKDCKVENTLYQNLYYHPIY